MLSSIFMKGNNLCDYLLSRCSPSGMGSAFKGKDLLQEEQYISKRDFFPLKDDPP